MDKSKVEEAMLAVLSAVGTVVSSSLPATIAVIVARALIKEFFENYQAGKLEPEKVKDQLQKLLDGLRDNDARIDKLIDQSHNT